MKISSQGVAVALAAIVVVAGFVALLQKESGSLTFRARAYPEGFRELVIEGASSGFDPILGLQGTSAGTRQRLSTREVCDALFRDPASPATGNANSAVQIAEFFDYRCPYCKTLSRILSDLQDRDIRIVYKEWPILGDSSLLAARAALAADRQDKYLALHARLMSARLVPTTAYVEELASELGLDKSRWREDMKADHLTRALERTASLASELGFTGSPGLVVGRTIVQGAITRPQLETLIEAEARLPKPC